MTKSIALEFPSIGHPVSGSVPWDFAEICTLLPGEPPKDWKVSWVIVALRWCESVNVVGNAFEFHIICDWGVNPIPCTVSRTNSASLEIASGESEAICGSTPRQLTKNTPQVQPDNSRVEVVSRAMRIQGTRLPGLAREERKRDLPDRT